MGRRCVHRYCVVGILEAVVGFVLDGGAAISLLHTGFHTATLHHEARNDPVKHGVVVVAFVHIGQEVGG